ncbi:MAG: GNAT family N-acetyltransferase [Xanthobacteraceae bacterium]|nr:GNAT family N-acetyltransferase [Xanthobacteraceae bacterium]
MKTVPSGGKDDRARPPLSRRTGRGIHSALSSINVGLWRDLTDRAVEPNGYYLPEWALAVDALSRNHMNNAALAAYSDNSRLIGLMPAIPAWRAYKLPLPALVSADVWPPLGTILLDRAAPVEAASALIRQARASGAHALILRDVALDGPAMLAFTAALEAERLKPRILQSHARALLDATRDADELLRDALGAKKLKELRRQRNRLAELGEVIYTIASTPGDVMPALDVFLKLEASGWKARRGTALVQDDSHAAFIRRAVSDLAARGQCEIISLYAGETPVAAGIVLRHLDRAFYFKLGVDEQFVKFSPGVQLTLELTRQMCADPAINSVDSTAIPNHPMIDPIWRNRLSIGDVLIPLRRNDPFVTLIRTAITARRMVRGPARRAIHLIRKIREKRS